MSIQSLPVGGVPFGRPGNEARQQVTEGDPTASFPSPVPISQSEGNINALDTAGHKSIEPYGNDRENRPRAVTFASRVRITSGIRRKDRPGPAERSDPNASDLRDQSSFTPNYLCSRSSSRASSASSFSVALRPPAATAPQLYTVPVKTSLSAVMASKDANQFLANLRGPLQRVKRANRSPRPRSPEFSSPGQGERDDRVVYDDRLPLLNNSSHETIKGGLTSTRQCQSILRNRNTTYDATSPPLGRNIYYDNFDDYDDDPTCSGFTSCLTSMCAQRSSLCSSGKRNDENSVISN
ncbi:uncharacterized protein EI90DRAFT_3013448 [Cantharellus anzutake]|uniref:uncharacterized protein n=1 Tax=Cantharellus anzutake TaxID=1750568 RepID=UPI001904503B|nr:uncharacterized protein EI90DRAFT_3013448 [Cantharellus anzutake]KAF8338144.1 hypothetical protein EI90DRAFT_3013448 [Cantharellus anzutake]